MLKKAATKLIGDYIHDSLVIAVGCTYSVALVIGTTFIILWILGWKKGIKASLLTLVGYAVINIFGSLL